MFGGLVSEEQIIKFATDAIAKHLEVATHITVNSEGKVVTRTDVIVNDQIVKRVQGQVSADAIEAIKNS